jgi:quercetin dioxygenase-like cupin family protein
MNAVMPNPMMQDSLDIAASIAPELKPLPIDQGRHDHLRRSVIERVRRSAQVHQDFTTVRREDATWMGTSPGVRQTALGAKGGMRVDLLKVAPGASIPWPPDAHAQEVLVIDGALVVSAEGSPPMQLSAMNQVVLGRVAAWRQTAGNAGAALYVRSRTIELGRLPNAEAQWWIAAQGASLTAAGFDCPWTRYLDGVDAVVLRACGDVASMLVRIAPGAAVPDHGHPLDEDCFVLAGDMFVGDILMRAGDYQLAPVGVRHVGIASDTGGTFYFHGAIPPSASEQAP